MLLNDAKDKGVNVLEETQVIDLLKDGEKVIGVRVQNADGSEREFMAPMTLDCWEANHSAHQEIDGACEIPI